MIDGKLYIVGGNLVKNEVSDGVLIYDFITQEWSEGSDSSVKRSGGATALYEGELYVFGGLNSRDNYSAYNPIEDRWSSLGTYEPLYNFDTAVVVGNHAYISASYDTRNAEILRYNFLLDSWDQFFVPAAAENYQDSFLYKGKIYLVKSNELVHFYIGDN